MTNLPHSPSADPSADPLDFIPVVRKIKRPDGWTAELQREFIRRVALNGSPQQTCIEMGKHASGVEALYKVPGADSFRAAWDHAVRVGRTAQGLDCGPPHLGPVPGIRRRSPPGARPDPLDDNAPDDDDEPTLSDQAKLDLFESIFRKYLLKVEREREARLAGRVVEADFTLRQVTCTEIALDLAALKLGTSGWDVIRKARMGEHGIFEIAETEMSRMLDAERRSVWEANGEPERPEHPPQRFLKQHDGYSTEPLEVVWGGSKQDREAAAAAREKQHREDAAAQVEWERRAAERSGANSQNSGGSA